MLFDLEYLQKLTYERSKMWANLLDDISKRETLEEIDIDNFEEVYGRECEKNDSEDLSMEDNECDNISLDSEELKNVTNATRLPLFLDDKTLVLPGSSKNDEKNQLIDIFNQTLPIINEHNRQLKETGFDKILSTFDKKKIEDKVGSWLNRHNSLFGGDNSQRFDSAKKKFVNKNESTSSVRRIIDSSPEIIRNTGKKTYYDSDESLQSGETARYIKSSRSGTNKSCGFTNTMIKTYRMVNSARETLHERYAYGKESNDYHVKTMHRRLKPDFAQKCQYRHDLTGSLSLHKKKLHHLPLKKQTRKVVRKRICSNSSSTTDLSSDSEYFYKYNRRLHRRNSKSCCRQHHCHNTNCDEHEVLNTKTSTKIKMKKCALKMQSARKNRVYYYSYSQNKSLTMSPSSSSSGSFYETHRSGKKCLKFHTDHRPCKRESECHCCNKNRLCIEYKHIADSSTDEWYVEDCDVPKKHLSTPMTRSKSYQSQRSAREILPAAIEDVNECKAKRNFGSATYKNVSKKNDKNIPQSKTKTSKIRSSSENESSDANSSYDRVLEQVLADSKKSYEKELERQICKDVVQKPKKQNNVRDKSPTKSTQEEFSNTGEIGLKRPAVDNEKKLSTEDKTIKKQPKLVDADNVNIINSFKNSTINSKDESCFGDFPSQRIYNSTALSGNSQAYNRQFCDQSVIEKRIKNRPNLGLKVKESKIKGTTKNKKHNFCEILEDNRPNQKVNTNTVTSTTVRSPIENSELSVDINSRKQSRIIILDSDENSDCSLVTSTTNIEPHFSETINKKFNETKKQNATLNSVSKHQKTLTDVVIYTPQNRNKVPSCSFTSDGYFTVTKEHLSNIIGEKQADKFMKYYIGRKRFNSNSTVFYRPPSATLENRDDTSSSSSDDVFDNLARCGELFESLDA